MDDFPENEEEKNGFEEMPEAKENSDYDADDIVNPIGYKLCRSAKAENKMFKLISKVQELYGFSQDQAIFILHYFKWNIDKIGEGLFISDEKDKEIKIGAGIALTKSPYKDKCLICSIKFTSSKLPLELPCGHRACHDCFKDYIGYNIEDKRCVNLQCWECKAKIPYSMYKHLPDEYFKKYTKWLIKSYTEDSKTIKWCPNENCDYFVEFSDMLAVDIRCMCGCSYCFKCNIESHKPTSCEWKYNWDQKNKGESEDINWIKANTKPCPNCKKYIEKNQGCNHMTCRECHHEFCWICFDPWKTHGSSYYNCIKFKDNKPQEGLAKELEDKSSMAKSELTKYIFYFDRYSEQHKAFLLAKKQKIQCASFCTQFCDKFKFPLSELEFLSIAFDVIIESRRILENTYIEMFYIANAKEKEMIEFLLERLQFFCDQLHEKVEQRKDDFLNETENHNLFFTYKNIVTGKMSLVKNAFDCFTKGIENGFSNVNLKS